MSFPFTKQPDAMGCGWYRYKNKFENGEFNICSMYKGENQLKKALLSIIR
jgi:hypothetical protein